MERDLWSGVEVPWVGRRPQVSGCCCGRVTGRWSWRQAAWWLDQLDEWGRGGMPVSAFVPASFPAVCQVLHPWGGTNGAPVRWHTLAEDGVPRVPWNGMSWAVMLRGWVLRRSRTPWG
jgi:hypothetical protein